MATNCRAIILFTTYLCCIGNGVQSLSTVVIPPVKEGAPEVGLVVIPGAGLRGETYRPLAEHIQRQSSLKLWVALTTGYRNDLPSTIQTCKAINIALTDLGNAGMAKDAPIFMAGHSLGGIRLQTCVAADPSVAAGIMLWSSYLSGRTSDLATFPTPVMHLSGDLDGHTRITRIAQPFRQLQAILETDANAVATHSVVTVQGVNHFQFSSGEIPPHIKYDLPPEVSNATAWTLLADVITDFMSYNVGVDTAASFASLTVYFEETKAKIAPLTAAKLLEWDGSISSWLITAQEEVAKFPPDMQTPVDILNVGYENQDDFEESKPSVVKSSDGVGIIVTRAMPSITPNPHDLAHIMDSATEIAGKMKNQEAIKILIPEAGSESSADCREINEAAFNYAWSIAPSVVRQRYTTKGRPLVFAEDNRLRTGLEWTQSSVVYTNLGDGSLQVTSSALYTDVNFPLTTLAGMYYCKLMSPYRALEWMYVDSLRPFDQQ